MKKFYIRATILENNRLVYIRKFETKKEAFNTCFVEFKKHLPIIETYEEDFNLYFERPFYKDYEQSLCYTEMLGGIIPIDIELIFTPCYDITKEKKSGKVKIINKK